MKKIIVCLAMLYLLTACGGVSKASIDLAEAFCAPHGGLSHVKEDSSRSYYWITAGCVDGVTVEKTIEKK